MIPINTSDGMTIPVALLADGVQNLLSGHLSFIMMIILVVTAIMTVLARILGRERFSKTPFFQNLLSGHLSFIMMIILVVTAIMTVLARILGRERFSKTPFFQNLLHVSMFWTITRVLAAVFAIMIYFGWGPEAINGEDTGGMLLDDLLHVLFSVFLFAGLFLPLLMNF